MTKLTLLALLGVCAAAMPARADGTDWKDLEPMLGEWAADPSPDGATGGFTLERGLSGQVLVRKNHASYPKTKDRPATTHEDLMVIYREGKATRADYWDNEGHAIHYGVAVDPGKSIVFLSEGPGPRFRLSYALGGGKSLKLRFEIAAPDHPDDWKTYIEAAVHKVR